MTPITAALTVLGFLGLLLAAYGVLWSADYLRPGTSKRIAERVFGEGVHWDV